MVKMTIILNISRRAIRQNRQKGRFHEKLKSQNKTEYDHSTGDHSGPGCECCVHKEFKSGKGQSDREHGGIDQTEL